jgi:hypothetical protein
MSVEVTTNGQIKIKWTSDIFLYKVQKGNGKSRNLKQDNSTSYLWPDMNVLDITIIGEPLSFAPNWTVEYFNSQELLINLNFEKPLEISSSLPPDKLRIIYLRPSFFLWADNYEEIIKNVEESY